MDCQLKFDVVGWHGEDRRPDALALLDYGILPSLLHESSSGCNTRDRCEESDIASQLGRFRSGFCPLPGSRSWDKVLASSFEAPRMLPAPFCARFVFHAPTVTSWLESRLSHP